jgi:hypothetical protein
VVVGGVNYIVDDWRWSIRMKLMIGDVWMMMMMMNGEWLSYTFVQQVRKHVIFFNLVSHASQHPRQHN